ncbi:hypothetical protein EGW08_006497 [Elysia chlorotica]|uniref:Uncharacterized protein n=1 Tax=Elysia chlorotica TaxID=188477 RepID=A0A433TVV6_ELYCH|nr:hypothetical protein EGW08_006497 [Elysia chlorotica]
MSSKWKGAYESNRKYQKHWENTFPWVKKAADGSENAFCKYCHCLVMPKTSTLERHESTMKHKNRVPSPMEKGLLKVTKTPRDGAHSFSRDEKKAEIEIADMKSECMIFKRSLRLAKPTYFNTMMDIIGTNPANLEDSQESNNNNNETNGYHCENTNDYDPTNGCDGNDGCESSKEEDLPGLSNGLIPDSDSSVHKTGAKRRHADFEDENEERHLWKNYIIKKTKLIDVMIEYYGIAVKKMKEPKERIS